MNIYWGKSMRIRAIAALGILAVFLIGGCATQKKAVSGDMAKEAQETDTIHSITDLEWEEDDVSFTLWLKSSDQLLYSISKLEEPLALNLFFPGTRLELIQNEYHPEGDVLSSIEAYPSNGEEQTARVTLFLASDFEYDVTDEDVGIKIVFTKPAAEMEDEPESIQSEEIEETTETETASDEWPIATDLLSIEPITGENGCLITVRADGSLLNYETFTIDSPARIVFELFDIKTALSPQNKPQTVDIDSKWAKRVRYYGYPDKMRLVVDTHSEYLKSFSSKSIKDGLIIGLGDSDYLDSAVGAPSSEEYENEENSEETIAEGPSEEMEASGTPEQDSDTAERSIETTEQTEEIAESEKEEEAEVDAEAMDAGMEKATAQKPAWVNRLDFEAKEGGKSSLFIGTTLPVEYEIIKTRERLLKLTLKHAKIPANRRRPIITTRFQSALDRITPMQTPSMAGYSVVALELREAVPYFVEQTEEGLQINFEASSIPPKPFEQAKLPSWVQVMRDMESSASKKPGEDITKDGGPAGEYKGEKIALDFYETDIKNVFRILKEISGKNFAVDADVDGKVTLSLEKPVPWDQVLDLVLKMNQLGYTEEGDIIRVATMETIKKEQQMEEEMAREKIKTVTQAKALEPLITEFIPINYAKASDIVTHLSDISAPVPTQEPGQAEGGSAAEQPAAEEGRGGEEAASAPATTKRGKISVDERRNMIIMTDTREAIERAKIIVRKLDQPTPQVIIEARIVEATATFSREFGTSWGADFGPSNSESFGGDLGYDMAMNVPATSSVASLGLSFTRLAGNPFTLNAQLEAMESEGEAKIISAPKVVTLDNKTAIIRQGIEYPYNKLDNAGNSTTEFKTIELRLEVVPHVTPDRRVSMVIKIDKNDLGSIINSQQSFTTKNAETELLVNDGDTVVIGGIIKTSNSVGETGLPGIRKIPLLGWLFKSKTWSDSKEELLIFITPRIVQLEQREVDSGDLQAGTG